MNMNIKEGKNEELLTEKGKSIVAVKDVVLSAPAIIKSSVVESLPKSDIESSIIPFLSDDNVTREAVIDLIIATGNPDYIQQEQMKTLLTKRCKQLTSSLEKNGVKSFQSSVEMPLSAVIITKKFGVSENHMNRHFHLSAGEWEQLKENGFLESYSKLKLTAIDRKITKYLLINGESFNKEVRHKILTMHISPILFDKKFNGYNCSVELVIQKEISTQLTSELTKILKEIESICMEALA